MPDEIIAREISRDPNDGILMENDVVGARIWGTPDSITVNIGASDIWDRRWFGERQPLITLDEIRRRAEDDTLNEIARTPNDTAYDLYSRYDFPCPKPGAQLILMLPFAETATVRVEGRDAILTIEGGGRRLVVSLWIALNERLIVIDCEGVGIEPGDVSVRVCRHQDTILPGEPLDPTLGDKCSSADFEPFMPPMGVESSDGFGVTQVFPTDDTFPDGFECSVAAAVSIDTSVLIQQSTCGLCTEMYTEAEGWIDHGTVKRYTPINEASASAETASLRSTDRFTVFASIATSTDSIDPQDEVFSRLRDAKAKGVAILRNTELKQREEARTSYQAMTEVSGETVAVGPDIVLPKLRKSGGHYGDIPLCSVGPTKHCFQDAAIWHADFHLNEIQAESHLALGNFSDVALYCDMIHTLLGQAQENARDVYNLPGAMYPLVHFPLLCRGIAHTNLSWELDLGLNGLICKPLWLYYRYTSDLDFLRDVAYPVLRSCSDFCRAYLTEGNDGKRHIAPTVSPEHWGITPHFDKNRDCTSALTLTRYLLNRTADAADILGVDTSAAVDWRTAADRLVDFPTYETPDGSIWVDVAGAPPIEYNIAVPLSPVFWGDEVGLDSDEATLEIARRTLSHIDVWQPHRFYLDRYVRPRLGICGTDSSLLPQHFLQSYQSIRLFPALPAGAPARMENMRTEGAFRVSASRNDDGLVQDVRIVSEAGGACNVANPWSGQAVVVRDAFGRTVSEAPVEESHLMFDTVPKQEYTLHPL
jgi:hypothetical protein